MLAKHQICLYMHEIHCHQFSVILILDARKQDLRSIPILIKVNEFHDILPAFLKRLWEEVVAGMNEGNYILFHQSVCIVNAMEKKRPKLQQTFMIFANKKLHHVFLKTPYYLQLGKIESKIKIEGVA